MLTAGDLENLYTSLIEAYKLPSRFLDKTPLTMNSLVEFGVCKEVHDDESVPFEILLQSIFIEGFIFGYFVSEQVSGWPQDRIPPSDAL